MARTLDALAAHLVHAEARLRQPMVVVSAGEDWWDRPEVDDAWRSSHVAMAAERPLRRRVVSPGSEHDIPAQDPDAIVKAIEEIISRVGRD